MQRVVLDANAVDPLIDLQGAQDAVRSAVEQGHVEVLYTHVTVEELAAVPDLGRRVRLLLAIIDLGRLVPAGAIVIGYWRIGHDRLGSDKEAFEVFRSGNADKHTRDALYAATAQYEGCDLVTNEHRLANRARERGVNAITSDEFLTGLGFDVAGARTK
jgi:predicted nucleic acid-binding protein